MDVLVDDVLIRVFALLPAEETLRCRRISRRFHDLIASNQDRMRKFNNTRVSIKINQDVIELLPLFGIRRYFSFEIRQPQVTDSGMSFGENLWLVEEEKEDTLWPNIQSKKFKLAASHGLRVAGGVLLAKLLPLFHFQRMDIKEFNKADIEEMFLSGDEAMLSSALTFFGIIELSLQPGYIAPGYRFPKKFFQLKGMKGLKNLDIRSMGGSADFGDEELLALKIELFDAFFMKTEVTLRGVRQFLDEYIAGERKIEKLWIEVRKDSASQTIREAYSILHDCIPMCDGDHYVMNKTGGILHIHSIENYNSHWKIHVDTIAPLDSDSSVEDSEDDGNASSSDDN